MKRAALVMLAACGSAPPKLTGRPQVLAASGDADRIAAMLDDTTWDMGLVFLGNDCRWKFWGQTEVTDENRHAVAACLAKLHWQPSERRTHDPSIVLLTYEGIEIAVELGDSRTTIDSITALPGAPLAITQKAMEALRTSGSVDLPAMWVSLCLDANAVISYTVLVGSSADADRVFGEAVATWAFRPFVIETYQRPVCARMLFGTPSDADDFVMPLDVTGEGAPIVFHSALRGRLVGTDRIELDEGNRDLLRTQPEKVVSGRVYYCVGTDGAVKYAKLARSSGWPAYDHDLVVGVQAWKFTGERTEDVCAYAELRHS